MKNTNFWIYVTAIILIIMAGLVGVSPARAQTQVQNVQTSEVSGEVLKVEDNRMTVQTDNGIKEYNVSSNIQIDKNSMNASLQDIQPGDRVTVMTSDTGEVLGVSAIAEQIFDWGRYAVPLALALLLLAVLVYSSWKKNNQGHIKTSVAHMGS